MLARGEFLERCATDTLCRRIGSQQFGIVGLKPLQLAEKLVVLGIRNGRCIKDVIGVVVAFQIGAQLGCALGRRSGCHHQENSR